MRGADDAVLVAAGWAGDQEAVGQLVVRHRPMVLAACRRLLDDPGRAEEAVQEACLRVLLGLGSLRQPERFAAWFCGIALNVCREWLRSEESQVVPVDLAGGRAGPELPAGEPGPAEVAEAREVAGRVRNVVADLPEGQRQAVEAFYLAGLPCREVAVLLATSVGAVKTRLFKARQRLRSHPDMQRLQEERLAMTTTAREWVEMRVAEVRHPTSQEGRSTFIVLLEEADGQGRRLPIWIGGQEAVALAFKLEGTELPRPMAHELLLASVEALDGQVTEVRVTALVEGTFYGVLVLHRQGRQVDVDARPSDVLNVALLAHAPIRVAAEVLAAGTEDRLEESLQAAPATARQIWQSLYPTTPHPSEPHQVE